MMFKNLAVRGCMAICIFLTVQSVKAVEMEDMTLVAEGQPTVTVTVVAPAVPTTPMDPSYIDPTIFKKEMLDVSNDYRQQHSAKPLVWNDTLAEYSKKWAESCDFVHSHGPYGENLAYGFNTSDAAVKAWGDEREFYNFTLPTGFAKATGHFTQLVWKASRQVGCAAVDCGYTVKKKTVEGKRNLEPDFGPDYVSEEPYDFEDLDLAKRDGEEKPRAQGWYLVCEYEPYGNIYGDNNKSFKKNVLPQKVETTTTASSTSTAVGAEPSKNAATSTTSPLSLHTGGAFKAGLGSTAGLLVVSMGTVCVGMGLYA
ncbi:hypothetical protein N7541_004844 [Penicillium brevicompactum]|uniref:SCP domain-containing protein n=1 Tax=Penicillium brevicompactum TaxID=5074 RepID=A0A9W9UWT3_PENBR|nr:hypothetical protein N7541_004844 [Penicillium brevicompactum]